MYNLILILISLLAFSGCAKDATQGPAGDAGPQGPPGQSAPQPASSSVQDVVDQENSYRESVGQYPLTQGLSCNLYTVPNTTTQIVGATLTSVASFTYDGNFNQPTAPVTNGFNVLPTGLQSYYQQWFILKCFGQIAIVNSDYYAFSITSDDGSNLYIDGVLIANNDGLHGTQTKASIPKILKRGIHSFELDFFQGGGSQALSLNASDGSLVPASVFYH